MSELNSNESRLAELKKLGELKEAGLLSDEEFEVEKNRLLNTTATSQDRELYKPGTHEGKSSEPAANLAIKRRVRVILYTIVRIYAVLIPVSIVAGLSSNPSSILAILVLVELTLLFVSRKREKKIGVSPWIFEMLKQWKSE